MSSPLVLFFINRNRARFTVSALLSVIAVTAILADEVRLEDIDNPRAIAIADHAVDARWHNLFDPAAKRPERDVAYLARHAADRLLTLLSARLLYRGGPWLRRSVDEDLISRVTWQRRDQEIKREVLRELRWHPHPSLASVYARLLASEQNFELIKPTLVNFADVAPETAIGFAVRLADPTREDALPGSSVTSVRILATTFLTELCPLQADQPQQALRYALLQGLPGERVHAARLLQRGSAPGLLESAAASLISDYRRGRLDPENEIALVIISARLRGVSDRALAADFARLAIEAERPLAAAAATALATGLGWDVLLPVDALLARALTTDDAAMRHALLALLVRLKLKPSVIAGAAGPGSPWARLATHRQDLERWDWHEVVAK